MDLYRLALLGICSNLYLPQLATTNDTNRTSHKCCCIVYSLRCSNPQVYWDTDIVAVCSYNFLGTHPPFYHFNDRTVHPESQPTPKKDKLWVTKPYQKIE